VNDEQTAGPEEYESPDDLDILAHQFKLLADENKRLRRELASAHRVRYRHAAIGTAIIGIIAVFCAFLLPVATTVLLALGGTGLLAAVLIRYLYLTPEQSISATVGHRVYEVLPANQEALTKELALTDTLVYVPIEDAAGSRVRLFVPQHPEYLIPQDEELGSVLVHPSNNRGRGVAFKPTGDPLIKELQSVTGGGFTADLETLADQLADGLVKMFELVDSVESNVDKDKGYLSIQVTNSTYGPVDRFDHPVASMIATAVADAQDTPVTLEVIEPRDGTYVIKCQLVDV
jgi:hypothetical protein